MNKRQESVEASRRKNIQIAHLVLLGFIRIGDEVVFQYQGSTYTAHIAAGPYIAIRIHASHTEYSKQDRAWSYYSAPTNFTRDCVNVYCQEHNRSDCRTKPSGYSNVFVTRLHKSLNELRDEALAAVDIDYVQSAKSVEDVGQAITAQDAARKTRDKKREPEQQQLSIAPENIAAHAAHLLTERQLTVATLREGKKRGYKEVAECLERSVTELCNVIHTYEAVITDLVQNASSSSSSNTLVRARKMMSDAMTVYQNVEDNDGYKDAPTKRHKTPTQEFEDVNITSILSQSLEKNA